MPLWAVQIERLGSVVATYAAENLSFQLNKKPPHTCQWEISHYDSDGSLRSGVGHDFIRPKYHDFKLLRGTTVIMAGPVTDFSVEVNNDYSTFAGKDWSYYLDNRHFPFDPNDPHPPAPYPGSANDYRIGTPPEGLAYQVAATDVTVIIKALLDVVLARPNSLAITYPTLTTALGIPTNFELPLADTSTMLQIIDSLSDIDPGFVYEILPTKELRLYSPFKYDPDVWDDSSLAVWEINTTTETNSNALLDCQFANAGPAATHILGTGPGIGQQMLGSALGYPTGQTTYRRWDEAVDIGEEKNRAALVNRTARIFSHDANPQHEISVTVDPNEITNFWTLTTAGQAIWLDIELVSHRIQSAQEIVSMDCSVDENGEETAVINCNQIYEDTTLGVEQA